MMQLDQPSLDRIYQRRLVLMIRKQISEAMETFADSWNDTTTRSDVKDVLSKVLTSMPIYDWMVVCDETNNSLSAVANNRIHVDVAFKHNENDPFVYMHAYTPGNHTPGEKFLPPTDLSEQFIVQK